DAHNEDEEHAEGS
nr:RecName: Full=Capsid protein VP1/VP2; AltName: Full=37 kDa protein; AltName: Full=Coat protein VP1/VP2 [Infectious hypodermal and hematopoietic necrosis virus strain Hawaii]